MTCGQPKQTLAAPVHPEHAWRTDLAQIARQGLLPELVRLLGADASEIREPCAGGLITAWRVRQGATLLHEGAPGQAVYVLRSGSLKCIPGSFCPPGAQLAQTP